MELLPQRVGCPGIPDHLQWSIGILSGAASASGCLLLFPEELYRGNIRRIATVFQHGVPEVQSTHPYFLIQLPAAFLERRPS